MTLLTTIDDIDYHIIDDNFDFDDAARECVELGEELGPDRFGRLAVISSSTINNGIQTVLDTFSDDENLWFGLRKDDNSDGQDEDPESYIFLDGTNPVLNNFGDIRGEEPWRDGQPRDNRDCIRLRYRSGGNIMEWEDRECDESNSVLCELVLFPTESPTEAPSEAPTLKPSQKPTISPSFSPTGSPLTSQPSVSPTESPTNNPTETQLTETPIIENFLENDFEFVLFSFVILFIFCSIFVIILILFQRKSLKKEQKMYNTKQKVISLGQWYI